MFQAFLYLEFWNSSKVELNFKNAWQKGLLGPDNNKK
jgi:hypothetical protein